MPTTSVAFSSSVIAFTISSTLSAVNFNCALTVKLLAISKVVVKISFFHLGMYLRLISYLFFNVIKVISGVAPILIGIVPPSPILT